MPRLFIAAWPDAGTKAALSELPRPTESGVRWVSASNWHITLRFIGEAQTDHVVTLLERAALPRTIAALGPRVDRLGPRRLVIPAAAVDALARAVRDATLGVGQADRRRFRGHLTIARTKPGARSAVFGAPIEASWTIDEVALVASDRQASGATYTTVATFPTT